MTALEIVPLLFTLVVCLMVCGGVALACWPSKNHAPARRYTPADFDTMDARVLEAIKAKHREGQRLAQGAKLRV